MGRPPTQDRPYIWNDHEQGLDEHIARIVTDIASGGLIVAAINNILSQ